MFTRIKRLVLNDVGLLVVNGFFCSSLLVFQLSRSGFSSAHFSRALGLSGVLFLLLLLGGYLFRSLVREALIVEFIEHIESEHFDLIGPFVLFREVCKAAVGAALLLGWAAVLFFIADAGYPFLLMAVSGALFSIGMLLLMYGLIRGVERIRLP